ncbi:hypothetical protein TWF718_005976 [Orbilia javanica]|uniref:Uncharacterized protein n=1 Tax=Orbilia javanica TaxID=47235 RepID=A0AAN8N4D5_9PEZI
MDDAKLPILSTRICFRPVPFQPSKLEHLAKISHINHARANIKPVSIPNEGIDYFALQTARRPLEDFAHATDYAERLYRKIYPYKPDDANTSPSDVVDGQRLVDITFEYLLKGFQNRLARAGNLVRSIKENRELPDDGAGQADIYTYGFKNKDQALQLFPKLEALYKHIASEKNRVAGIHRWIRNDLTNGNLKAWESNLVLVAWSVIGARVDFDPEHVVYDPSQQGLWSQCLDETEWRLKGVKDAIGEIRDMFAKNPERLASTTSFDFNFDFKAHLKRLSDWFGAWHNAVSMLHKSYSNIPRYKLSDAGIGVQFEEESFSTYPSEPEVLGYREVSETEVVCPDDTGVGQVPKSLFHYALNCKPGRGGREHTPKGPIA